MIRAKSEVNTVGLEVNTVELKKLVLLAGVSTASRSINWYQSCLPGNSDGVFRRAVSFPENLASIQTEVKLHSTEIASLKRGEGTSQPRTDELTAQLRPHPEPNNTPYGKLIRIEFLKFSGDDVKDWYVKKYPDNTPWEHFEIEVVKRGLKLEVRTPMRMFQANTISEAYQLARMQEATNTILKPRYNTPLLPTPKQSTTTTTYASKAMTTPTKTNSIGQNSRYVTRNWVHKPYRLTQKELEDKRAKGQCFYCDQKFVPGHKCSGQLHSIEVITEGDLDNYIDGDDETYKDCVSDMGNEGMMKQAELSSMDLCVYPAQLCQMESVGIVSAEVEKVLTQFAEVFEIPKDLPPQRSHDALSRVDSSGELLQIIVSSVVTPPKSGSSGMVTMGCYVIVQQTRYRKRP
uniref:Reverse transcriptase domain-containing protein n=1 Tax=Tanacetum cinerariifolium TaxID=118510 RepID=A0A6L2KQI5_TANCI|nr:hypothetical protein [Tanacetum cinerariifolium]